MHRNRSTWGLGMVLVLGIGIAACGSEGTPTSSKVDTTVSSTDVGTVPVSAAVSTTSTTVVPPPDGVVRGDTLLTDSYWSIRTIAHGDEFLEFSAVDGKLEIARSTDGVAWTSTPTDLAIDGVSLVTSSGAELFVSSGWGSTDSQPPTVSVSADDGATWTTSPLSAGTPTSAYVMADTSISALAVTGGAAVAVGTVFLRGDWEKYSIEVLGTDHGHVTSEGGFSEQWTVEFEDGFEMTVDLAAIGLQELGGAYGPRLISWLRTGTDWERVDLPFTSPSPNQLPLAAGPNGFLTVGFDADSMTEPMTAQLYRSADGRTWEAADLPDGLTTNDFSAGIYLAGGSLGYVLIGETWLSFSPDGISWTRAAEYGDLSAEASGFLSTFPPAAGPAGFAVAFADPTGSSGSTRVLVSHDGRSWDQVALPDPAFDAMVAVGDDTILVRPVTQPAAPSVPPIDTSVIAAGPGVGGAGGQRPGAMCDAPEMVTLVAYDLDTGDYRWHLCGTDVWYSLEAVTDDTVYVADINMGSSEVVALDAATGEERGSLTAAQMLAELPDDAALSMAVPPELDGLRLKGGQDDALVVSDASTGERIWSVMDHLAYDDVWAVGDDAVYMAHIEESTAGPSPWTLRAYELQTGEVRWEVEPTSESYPWWVADGRVFSMWTDLTVLSTDTGEVLWATDYETPGFPGMRGVLANSTSVFVTFASAWGGGD